MNIQSKIKQANQVLFCDSEVFNKDITGVKNLEDIKDLMQIKGRLYKVADVRNQTEYKLSDSTYKFSLIFC
jgi:hypothetical protein